MGSRYTVDQQALRLPERLQEYYKSTQLDRVQIDGEEFSGFFEYTYLDEKTYFTEPSRSLDGTIENLNSYTSFLTAHLKMDYTYMQIEDYRRLMRLLNSKNEFTVTAYDIVNDTRVTRKMYFATPNMPKVHTRYLQAKGILNYTVELIATNADMQTYNITYNYNIPSDAVPIFSERTAQQTFTHNISDTVGRTATFKGTDFDSKEQTYLLSSINGNYSITTQDENGDEVTKTRQDPMPNYIFECWNTKADGTGFGYRDGDAYFFTADQTLYAKWRKSV